MKVHRYWFKVFPWKFSRSPGEPGLEFVEIVPVNWLAKFGTWIGKWGSWKYNIKYMDSSGIECGSCHSKIFLVHENITRVECPKCHQQWEKEKVPLEKVEVSKDGIFPN